MIIVHNIWALAVSDTVSRLFQTKNMTLSLWNMCAAFPVDLTLCIVISYRVMQSRRNEPEIDTLGYHTSSSDFQFTHFLFTLLINKQSFPSLHWCTWLCFFLFLFSAKEAWWDCSSVACQMCNWIQKMLYHLENSYDWCLITLSSRHDQSHSVW